MPCNTCAKPFSLLRKEKGCPGCGFSYCSNCLNNKMFLKKLNAEAKVCIRCKHQEVTVPKVVQPPDAYFKRLESLPGSSQDRNLEPRDQEILSRLTKLKQDMPQKNTTNTEDIAKRLQNLKGEVTTVSDSELQSRLAKLKGVSITETDKKLILTCENKSEQEQADALMKQYMEQAKIEGQYKDQFDKKLDDMYSRFQNLKGGETSQSMGEKEVQPEDEEETVKKIVMKMKAESALEIEDDNNAIEELPFCEICNEDATLRCLGCQYIFCKQCYLEHKDDDEECNKYEPYKPPNKSRCLH